MKTPIAPGFERDPATNAVINNDRDAYKTYKQRREERQKLMQLADLVRDLQQQVAVLTKKVQELQDKKWPNQ